MVHFFAARNFPEKPSKKNQFFYYFQLSVTEVQLSAASEERDTLRDDLSNSGAGRDALIRKAWDVRDAAVKRKNSTQIELAKSRIDVMQVRRREKHISCLVHIGVTMHFLHSRSTPSSWSPSSRRLSSLSSLTSGRRTWRSCWRTRW